MANTEFKVRLSRTSSAQAVLKKELKIKSAAHNKLDNVIDDDKSTDTVTGKLPVEAAYVTMKRITEEVGQPLNAAGRSTFNKLQSLKTTPAVDLLVQKTWREFFTKKAAVHSALAGKTATADQYLNPHTRTSAEDVRKGQHEMKAQLALTFNRLVGRVENLWRKLKIPTADQEFYRKTLCKGPPQSVEQCREVAQYVLALKTHEQATLAVVQAIQVREMAIAKCFDVLAALQRKLSRSLSGSTLHPAVSSLGGTGTWNSATRFNFAATDETKRLDGTGLGMGEGGSNSNNSFWKEELICALDDVRGCTLEVIKRIQRWRRNLWRPHPFVYMGLNYVSKMKDDLTILESGIYGRLLAMVPLRYADLQCILFLNDANKIVVDGNAHGQRAVDGASRSPSGHASGTSTPFPPPRSAATTPVHHQHHQDHQPGHDDGYSRIEQLLHEFRSRVSARELQLAAAVVLEEDVLQNALAIEQASLLQKGVFIPTLHARREGGERVVSRGQSQQGIETMRPSLSAPAPVPQSQSRPSSGHQAVDRHAGGNSDSRHGDEGLQQTSRESREVEEKAQNGMRNEDLNEEEIDWAPDFSG